MLLQLRTEKWKPDVYMRKSKYFPCIATLVEAVVHVMEQAKANGIEVCIACRMQGCCASVCLLLF